MDYFSLRGIPDPVDETAVLTDQDLSHLTQTEAVTVAFSGLPGSAALVANGRLPAAAQAKRSLALAWDLAKHFKLWQAYAVNDIAASPTPDVFPLLDKKVSVRSPAESGEIRQNLRGVDRPIEGSYDAARHLWYAQDYEASNLGIGAFGARARASLFLQDSAASPAGMLALTTGLQARVFLNTPKDSRFPLYEQFRGAALVRQLRPMGGNLFDLDKETLSHYRHAYAAAVADCTLRQMGVGEATRKNALNASYIGMLSSVTHHRPLTAPTTEALLRGDAPASYLRIDRAVSEIQYRILMEDNPLCPKGHRDLSSDALFTEIRTKGYRRAGDPEKQVRGYEADAVTAYIRWAKSEIVNSRPSSIFSRLRALVTSRSITDPVARVLSERILEASNALNPSLSQSGIAARSRLLAMEGGRFKQNQGPPGTA